MKAHIRLVVLFACGMFVAASAGCAGKGIKEAEEVTRYEVEIGTRGYSLTPRKILAYSETVEQDTAPPTQIVSLEKDDTVLGMDVTPDQTRIIFSLVQVEKANKEKGERSDRVVGNLRSVPISGGGISQMTTGNWVDAQPACAKDGYIYFASDRIRRNFADIFRVAGDRASGIEVVRQTTEGTNLQPSLSGSDAVVYTFIPSGGRGGPPIPQLWTVKGSGYPTQLREGSQPAISPDGKEMAYIGVDRQLWLVSIGQQNPAQLTTTPIVSLGKYPLGKRQPRWSPDGKWIIYAAAEGKEENEEKANYDLWVISRRGGNAIQLTTNPSWDTNPVVSPDQKTIYFASDRGKHNGIWSIPFPSVR
jgi:hypothetical protein